MLVNYKGRPWMKGATENPGLLYSLAACVAGVVIASWEVCPARPHDPPHLDALPVRSPRRERTVLRVLCWLGVGDGWRRRGLWLEARRGG